ncbi:glycoside hydrolase family 2 protein [Silvibacterium dinghuense]|uniref:Glycoside hydrolase family 2 protein n=1 Tax=Silvibacterium dinghuense TaxID=1560006 RepID=A0A4Q1S9I9_9BACT|nr:glycoside hydrolase family 2 TIM barrel-domain containing protein [Silvibacterium dinghuense]RXS93647.1 glycoside hydrolase family 2 protein [Silvibacterium dinghuense]GGH06432.1 beta-galactosidase [Silvibacterium dinghuense]
MNRRFFLKSSGLAAGATLVPAAMHGMAEQMDASQHALPRIVPINQGWLFSPAVMPGDTDAHFNDAGYAPVVLPHTNKLLPWHSFDDADYEFISSYRRHFRLPRSAREQRVFVDFEGAMTASTVWINGHSLGEYKGGYTHFSFELTPFVNWDGDNVLAVHLDSTERKDIPPFGYEVDYMTFGGIYREVNLRIVPRIFLENLVARAIDPLSPSPSLEVESFFESSVQAEKGLVLHVELRDGDRVLAQQSAAFAPKPVAGGGSSQVVTLEHLSGIELWDLQHPKLYSVHVQLRRGEQVHDEDSRRIGFREAHFTPAGFSLNGNIVKLRGLDRHQTFPFVGQAMPARVQRRDAWILRHELKCNIVRTSHYPQSRHFLDACDELGLLVLEEIPGWQHIGDAAWQDIAVDNVGRMIRRDWNHPSIILWGVRINESKDDHDFYTRTNAAAHALDKTRQTGGIRSNLASELLEDVYTNNDFGFPLHAPVAPLYLNTEFVGHTFPTRSTDNSERQREHTLRHARIHDQIASSASFSGGIGWCAFDYNTHFNFGSGDRICYHGVSDIFRLPKPAAGFYKSQCDPAEEVVLEPAFHWARNDENVGFTTALVCSNCDHLKFYLNRGSGFELIAEADPDRQQFSHLRYPPFSVPLDKKSLRDWGDLRIDGYIQGKQVISKSFSGRGVDRKFHATADDLELHADGADTTRIVLRVTDEFDRIRPIANDPIVFDLSGPAQLIGDNPFSLIGGTGAIWIRATRQPGTVVLRAKHPRLGTKEISIQVTPAASDLV